MKRNLLFVFVVIILSNTQAQTVKDIEGNVYKTVKIGNQEWMAENLRTTKFKTGVAIPLVTNDTKWTKLVTPAYCWYNNNDSLKNLYGGLYNFYAVKTGKLCPAGWHVPSDAEWTILEKYLLNNGFNYNSDTTNIKIGRALKATKEWKQKLSSYDNLLDSCNLSGFSAYPSGCRYFYEGTFLFYYQKCYWWSSTAKSGNWGALSRSLNTDRNDIFRDSDDAHYGYSVRCIKDN
jgi:uncharacterized protein (TIGR02145 family)